MSVLAVAYFAAPTRSPLIWALFGVGGAVFVVLGVRVNRPRLRLPWYLFAFALVTLVAGDITYDVLTEGLGQQNPFPSLADVIYLVMYPVVAAALLMVVRARSSGSDRAALLDALIVTAGLGLLSWVFLIKPYVGDETLTWFQKVFAVAYPMGDVLILAVLVRLLAGGAARSHAMRLLTLGTVGLLASDVLYGLIQLNGTWETGGPVDAGWIVFYVAWGAAALQPDMVDLAEPGRQRVSWLSRGRLFLLTGASLIAPLLILVESFGLDNSDVSVAAVTSIVVFGLVTARLDGLVRQAQQSGKREHALRRVSQSLVGAPTREHVYRATAHAVLEIGGGRNLRAVVATGDGAVLTVVYDSHRDGESPESLDVSGVLARYGHRVREQQLLLTHSDGVDGSLRSMLGPGVPVLIAPLPSEDGYVGMLVVAGDGAHRPVLLNAVGTLAAQASLAMGRLTLTDQVMKRRSEAHFRSLIQHSSDVILILGEDLSVRYATPSADGVLGFGPTELHGRPMAELLHPDDAAYARVLLERLVASSGRGEPAEDVRGEWRIRQRDGYWRSAEVVCTDLLHDPTVQGVVLTLHDVTERRTLEEELTHRAFHDSLTGLANRALFMDRLEQALRRQGRHRERLAVLLVDLDDFKIVNDTRGHEAGDVLLVAVADRLVGCLRDADTAARLSGDEFAVFVEWVSDDDEARQVAERIIDAMQPAFPLGGLEVSLRVSIGIATTEYEAEASELLRHADLAMYAAKDAGKGGWQLYRASMHEEMLRQVAARQDLEAALEREEFVLHYQPVVEVGSGELVGFEALVRWQHPERGLVHPGEFIDVVENSDVAITLGEWVLNRAVAEAARWREGTSVGRRLRMNVNVAPRQLRHPRFVETVRTALEVSGLPATALTLEITERLLITEEAQVVVTLGELRDLGVGIAVDDFGTGYSALAYLRRFPITELKIDRAFVARVDRSSDDHSLVEAIVGLAETFGLDIVAEGVETPEQQAALVALGCRYAQGYRYSPAVPAHMVDRMLSEHGTSAFVPSTVRQAPETVPH